MNKKIKIAPSVLAADFANLQRDIEMINDSEADLCHIDIMDGIFVPNISFGFPVCAAINRHATKPMDFHLMIKRPELYLESCVKTGARIISVHIETCPDTANVIKKIKALNCRAGIAINPETPIETLREFVKDLDVVIVMSVIPGFGGQEFMPVAFDKVHDLREMINETGSQCEIEIDGGVTMDNAPDLVATGVDIIVAGSFVFNSASPKNTISQLKALSR